MGAIEVHADRAGAGSSTHFSRFCRQGYRRSSSVQNCSRCSQAARYLLDSPFQLKPEDTGSSAYHPADSQTALAKNSTGAVMQGLTVLPKHCTFSDLESCML